MTPGAGAQPGELSPADGPSPGGLLAYRSAQGSCSACTSARRRTSCRVASTNRSPGGARVISSSSCRSVSGPSSSIIDHRPQPVIQRRQIRQQPLGDRPAVHGPAPPSPPAPAATPGAVCRNAASTDSRNRCGSRSSRPAGTDATRADRPAWLIQDRNSTVLPLPAGAAITATRAGPASRPNSPGRATTLPVPDAVTRPATESDIPPGPTPRIIPRSRTRA